MRASGRPSGEGHHPRGAHLPPDHVDRDPRDRGRLLPEPEGLVHLPRLHERARVRHTHL